MICRQIEAVGGCWWPLEAVKGPSEQGNILSSFSRKSSGRQGLVFSLSFTSISILTLDGKDVLVGCGENLALLDICYILQMAPKKKV